MKNKVPEGDVIRLMKETAEFGNAGKTSVLFEKSGRLLGLIALADSVRDDSVQAIRQFKEMGIRTIMLTGDRKKTAEAIAAEVGVDEVIAEVLPDGKEEVIRKLMEQGRTAIIGDGINDAPALTRANVGIAIGAGTDVAIDAADVVLMKSSLADVSAAVRLSRQTYKTILWGLFWALCYNTILIPIAAGLLTPLGITMDPMFGALAMSLSSFCVVTNALRLNRFAVHSSEKDTKLKNPVQRDPEGKLLSEYIKEKEAALRAGKEKEMTKTMKIEGMMCMHCEATVKKALEALDGVESAEVSHEKGTAVVTMEQEVADEVLKGAVEAKDYKVTGIE